MRSQYGGDKLVRDVETAAKLVNSINALGNSMGVNFTAVKDMFAWMGPVLMALQGNAICDADPSCSETRAPVPAAGRTRAMTEASTRSTIWPDSCRRFEDKQTLNATVNQLDVLHWPTSPRRCTSMGLDQPGGAAGGPDQTPGRAPTASPAGAGKWPTGWTYSSTRSN